MDAVFVSGLQTLVGHFDGQEPGNPGISHHRTHVSLYAQIVDMAEFPSFSVRVEFVLCVVVVGVVPAAVLKLDGGVVSEHEVHQKSRENAHGHGKCERKHQHENEVEQEVRRQFKVLVYEKAVYLMARKNQEPAAESRNIAQALDEELMVSVTNATRKPRTVVVHL